jgi:hypothetical protein
MNTVEDKEEKLLDNRYEQMCISLYTYRYGALDFLDLIAKFEEMLGLPSPQTEYQKALDQTE